MGGARPNRAGLWFMRSYILHPHGESFGPFSLDFIRQKLDEGAISTMTGVTILVDGTVTPCRLTPLAVCNWTVATSNRRIAFQQGQQTTVGGYVGMVWRPVKAGMGLALPPIDRGPLRTPGDRPPSCILFRDETMFCNQPDRRAWF